MHKDERILAIVGVIGALASIATAVDYFLLSSTLSHTLKIPDTLPTGIFLIVLGPLLIALAGALFLVGRSSTTNQSMVEKNNELNQKIKTLLDELAREKAIQPTLFNEVEKLRLRLEPLTELPTRIRGILKTHAHSRRELVEALGLQYSNADHTQAVAKSVGEMDDVTKNSIGNYALKDSTEWKARN